MRAHITPACGDHFFAAFPKFPSQRSAGKRRPEPLKYRFPIEALEPRIVLASVVTLIDSDGDLFKVKLSGPGTASVTQLLDAQQRGPIDSITLSGATARSVLSVSVTQAAGGDGEVSIGKITSARTLLAVNAPKSDVTGEIAIGGGAAKNVALNFGSLADGFALTSRSRIGSLTAQSIGAGTIAAPAIGALAATAGPLLADLAVGGDVNSIAVTGGDAAGDWSGLRFDRVKVVGGDFAAVLNSTSAGALRVFGGDLTGVVTALGRVDFVRVATVNNLGGAIDGATLTTRKFGTLSIARDVAGSLILAGANLGADHAPGGSGAAADVFSRGKIDSLIVGGSLDGSIVGAGLTSFDSLFGNADDFLVTKPPLTSSAIAALSIGGAVTPASGDLFAVAGATLPRTVKIGGVNVRPLTDARFFTINPADRIAPVVSGALTDDSGSSPSDAITMNAEVAGQIVDAGRIVRFRAGIDARSVGAFVDVSADLASNRTFALGAARLAAINGAPLADGAHTLHVQAIDQGGNARVFDLAFTLDTTAPVVQLTQGGPGATLTTGARLVGTASGTGSGLLPLSYRIDAGTAVPLATNAFGAFRQVLDFTGLATATHTLTVSGLDLAGNAGSVSFDFAFDPNFVPPFTLAGLTPVNGAGDVGVIKRKRCDQARSKMEKRTTLGAFPATPARNRGLPRGSKEHWEAATRHDHRTSPPLPSSAGRGNRRMPLDPAARAGVSSRRLRSGNMKSIAPLSRGSLPRSHRHRLRDHAQKQLLRKLALRGLAPPAGSPDRCREAPCRPFLAGSVGALHGRERHCADRNAVPTLTALFSRNG